MLLAGITWVDVGGFGISLSALVVSVVSVRTSRAVAASSRSVAAVQVVREFSREFNSREVRRARRALGHAWLAGNPAVARSELPVVMNLFDTVGWTARKGVVDVDHVYSWLGDWIMSYWVLFSNEVTYFRRPRSVWGDAAWLVMEMEKACRADNLDPTTYFAQNATNIMSAEASA